MKFVKFGNLYINFDNVTYIRDLSPPGGGSGHVLRVEFTSGSRLDLTDSFLELKAWLDQNLAPPTSPSPPPSL